MGRSQQRDQRQCPAPKRPATQTLAAQRQGAPEDPFQRRSSCKNYHSLDYWERSLLVRCNYHLRDLPGKAFKQFSIMFRRNS